MSRSLAAAVGAVVLTASSVLAVPGPAHAGDEPPSRVVLRDRPGDVVSGEYPWRKVVRANKPTVDITRAVVRHGAREVRVKLRFANLRRINGSHLFVIFFSTPTEPRLVLDIDASPDRWRGSRTFERNSVLIRCRSLTHDIDYAADLVTVRVPRHCIGTPDWVQLRIFNELLVFGEANDWYDSAHDRNLDFNPGRPTPRLSPP